MEEDTKIRDIWRIISSNRITLYRVLIYVLHFLYFLYLIRYFISFIAFKSAISIFFFITSNRNCKI